MYVFVYEDGFTRSQTRTVPTASAFERDNPAARLNARACSARSQARREGRVAFWPWDLATALSFSGVPDKQACCVSVAKVWKRVSHVKPCDVW